MDEPYCWSIEKYEEIEQMGYRTVQNFFNVLLICLAVSVAAARAENTFREDRFVKLDRQGKALPEDAGQWAMVLDRKTDLYWEVKTTDGSIHDRERTFSYEGAREELIRELNAANFGGFSDWRLPTTDELRSLLVKGVEPYIDQAFFPHTVPTSYHSWRECGNGDIYDERVKFGKIRSEKTERRARAVRKAEPR